MPQNAGKQKTGSKLPIVIGCIVAVVAVALLAVALLLPQSAQHNSTKDEAIVQSNPTDTQAAEPTEARYILVVGEDAWPGGTGSRSDLFMLMRVDTTNNIVHEVSIPRDTSYTWTTGATIKANQAYEFGGIEAALEAARTITGIDVQDYVIVGFDGFQSIIDHFGGIDVNLPVAIDYHFYTNDHPDEHFDAGEQTLTPWRAMALSRARTGYSQHGLEEDMMRQVIDRQMLTTLIGYVYSSDDPTATIGALLPFIKTNLTADDLMTLADNLFDNNEITVYCTTGPVDGGIDSDTQLWLVPYDPNAWSALMDVVDQGGDPATSGIVFTTHQTVDSAPINETTVLTR